MPSIKLNALTISKIQITVTGQANIPSCSSTPKQRQASIRMPMQHQDHGRDQLSGELVAGSQADPIVDDPQAE